MGADRTERLAIIVTAEDLAAGKLGKVRKELAGMGPAGKLAAIGLGSGMVAIKKGEQALTHLGNRITSLAGPLGLIGLTGAAFGLSGAMVEGIKKATDWGLAIEKLQGLTSNTAEQLSGLLGITEKYGISNERLSQIVGFTEKTLGKLEVATTKGGAATKSAALKHLELVKAQRVANGESTKTINKLIAEQKARDQLNASLSDAADGTTKLTKLEAQYGVKLTDNKGKVLDFQSVLLNVADAYSKATTAADKAKVAALSASVFGRGYADLIPILKLGRKGILDAEEAAKELGLTLSQSNVEDLAKYREAMREAGDATSGLQLQLGLLAIPDLTDVLKSFTEYMRSHRADVEGFFKSALHTAEGFAAFVTGTVIPTIRGLLSSASGFWNSIPAPLREILAKGFVADRTINFLFGFSPVHAIIGFGESAISKGLGGALGGLFQRGGSPANPMWVAQVGGPGAIAGGPGLASMLLTALPWAVIGASIAAPIIVGIKESLDNSNLAHSVSDQVQKQIGSGASLQDLQKSLAAVDQGLGDLNNMWGAQLVAGDSITQLQKQHDDLTNAINAINHRGNATPQDISRIGGNPSEDRELDSAALHLTKAADVVSEAASAQHHEWAMFAGDMHKLVSARKPEDVQKAAKAIADRIAEKDQGSLASTLAAEKAIKEQLKRTHDPETAKVLRAALAKVESKIPGRQYVERQITEAKKIAGSTESTKQKVHDLKAIEGNLLSHGDKHAASQIAHLIEIQKNTLATAIGVNATRGAGGSTAPGAGHTGGSYHPAPSSGGHPGGSKPTTIDYGLGRASGGPIWPGNWTVGEEGPERMTIRPDGTGFVSPASRHGLMAPSLARQVFVQLQLSVHVAPRLSFGLSNFARKSVAEARYGKVSAG